MLTINNIKVLVDARGFRGANGGVSQHILGLVKIFSTRSAFEEFTFHFLVSDNSAALDLVEAGACKERVHLLKEKSNVLMKVARSIISRLRLLKIPLADWALCVTRKFGPFRFEIETEPNFIKSENINLIHFASQVGFNTCIPNVYQPHDLLHMHYPMHFSREALYLRSLIYPQMMANASRVIVGTQWTLDDFVNYFPQFKAKLGVINVYSPRTHQIDEENQESYSSLQYPYILYPANYWPHKNHVNLILAFNILAEKLPRLHLVLIGFRNHLISEQIMENLSHHARPRLHEFGYVSESDKNRLLKHAECIVVPSLFESESIPIMEAMQLGVPFAASNIPQFREQVGESGVFFDPLDPTDIASKISFVLDKSRETLTGLNHISELRLVETLAHEWKRTYLEILSETQTS